MKHNFHIHHYDTLSSTNDHAKAHIHSLQEYDVIWSDEQTKGRGRFDRIWQSGNDITFTMVFRTLKERSLIVPLAVIQALRTLQVNALIKWPNDILMNDKKVCGILIEKVYEGNQWIGEVCGIGINVSLPPLELQDKATCIETDRESLLMEILVQYERLEQLDKEELLQMYRSVKYLQGRKILLNDVLWNVEDITDEGYLILANHETSRILKSEEVTLAHIY